MPEFEIIDPSTGVVNLIESDRAPTQEEAVEYLSSIVPRGTTDSTVGIDSPATDRGGLEQALSQEMAKSVAQQRLVARDPDRLMLVNEGFPDQNVGVKGQGVIPQILASTVGGGFTSGPARLLQDALLKAGLTSQEVVDAIGVQRVAEENPASVMGGNIAGAFIPGSALAKGANLSSRLALSGILGGAYGASESVGRGGVERITEEPGQLSKDALTSAALSTLIPAALAAPAGLQRIVAGKIDPKAAQILQIAEEMNIPLTAAQATGSRQLGLGEKLMQNLPTSSGIMQRRTGEVQSGLQAKAAEMLESSGPANTPSSFGAAIQDVIEPATKRFKENATLLYDAFENAAPPGASIPLGNVMNVAKSFIEREGKTEGFASSKLISELETFVAKEAPEPQVITGQFGEVLSEVAPKKVAPSVDLRTFQDIRSKLNDEIQSLEKNEKMSTAGKLKIVKAEMDKSLDNFAETSGNEVKYAFHVANKFYENGANIFFDPAIKRILSAHPEAVSGLIVKPNAVTDINTLKKALGPKGFEPVQRAFMERILATEAGAPFSVNKALTASGKVKPDTLEAVFGKSKIKEINEFMDVAKAIAETERRVGNPSGTAQNLVSFSSIGLMFSSPQTGAAALLAPPILAKLYTSKTGTKLLTEAIQTPLSSRRATELNARLSSVIGGEAVSEDPPKRGSVKMRMSTDTKPLETFSDQIEQAVQEQDTP